jgi:hypothetical protein
MAQRRLTITLQPDWQAALRAARGGVLCPFDAIHVDLRLHRAA